MLSVLGNDMDAPTGYRRWLIGLIVSLLSFGGSVLYATYAAGQNTKQIEFNTSSIEKLEKITGGAATKDDLNRIERKIERIEDKLDKLSDRK